MRIYRFDPAIFPHYAVRARIDRAARSLHVSVSLQAPRSLVRDGTLVIALTESASNVRIWQEARGARADIQPVKRDDANTPAALRRWTLELPDDVAPGDVTLGFEYVIVSAASVLFAVTADGAVASGTGTAWYPQVERQNGVRLEGLGCVEILSPGDTIVGGGASPNNGRFEITAPRYFDFAAAPYRVVASRGGRANLYLLRDHPHLDVFAERLERLIEVLEAHFGPLPQPRFDLAEAPPQAARDGGFDGASLDGFMLAVGSYFDQPFNTAFFGHEVSHQWWGGLVRRAGANGAYVLDESLAQLGSMIAVEEIEGAAAAQLYRRRGAPGYYSEYSGFMYLARTLAQIDAPITALPVADGFTSRRVVNSKGMLVWAMAAELAGRRRFFGFLRDFVDRHAYRRATLDELMNGLRDLLGPNAAFVDDWLARPGAPTLALEWTQVGRTVVGHVRQDDAPRRVQAPIEIRYRNGRRLQRAVLLDAAETRFEFAVRSDVREVVLDPEFRVLRWTPHYREEAEALLPYIRGDIALNYGRNDEARVLFESALRTVPPDEQFGLRALLLRGLGDVAAGEQRNEEAVRRYRDALQALPQWPYQLPELWRALAGAYRALGDAQLADEANAEGARAIENLRQLPADG